MLQKARLGLAALLVLALLGCLGCTSTSAQVKILGAEVDDKQDIIELDDAAKAAIAANTEAAADFSWRLFQQTLAQAKPDSAENVLVSPLSVLYALGMTANGAAGQTLAQMEQALGFELAGLNEYLLAYRQCLAAAPELTLANSIWLRDTADLQVEPAFLDTNRQYYNAEIYAAPFNDDTLSAVNGWVKKHTNGMIERVLDKIAPEAVLYLINAVALEAEWEDVYEDYQVQEGLFTTAAGEERQVQMMYASEWKYLADGEQASGFVKFYKGRYAFVALLPAADLPVEEYAAQLSGSRLLEVLNAAQNVEVRTSIPQFTSEYSLSLNQILQNMGMIDAFDGQNADFTNMATYTDENIYIGQVLHKTFIQVDQQGTKAGAVTAVEMTNTAAIMPREYKEVYLNRPFVYLLVDWEHKLPLFIGIVNDIDQ